MCRAYQRFSGDKIAAAHMLYFLISAALFMPLIGGMIYFMQDVTESQRDDTAGLEPKARVLLDRLMGSPGANATSTMWQDRPVQEGNELVEAGIRHDTQRFRLSSEKILNLQRGGLIDNPKSSFVDYPELKDALNVDDRFDFHLRMSPTGFDRKMDPYGSQALGATHVAYIGALKNDATFNGDFTEYTDDAQNEINALDALGIGPYKEGQQGFTTESYYPRTCDGLNPLQPIQHGTVIADTGYVIQSRDAGLTCLLADDEPYWYWFLQNYFLDANGDYRFDALIFGTGVDLGRWQTAAGTHDNASINQDLFLDFVKKGGTIIFLDNNGASLPADFITECSTTDCIFNQTGQQVGLNIPDDTNQMLFAPNRLPPMPFRDAHPWELLDHNDGFNESHGFIPMLVPDDFWEENAHPTPSYFRVHVGATSSDRYNGQGTVILSNWDLPQVGDDDLSRVFSNLLSYGVLRTAYLDYGPQLPDERSVRAVAQTGILELPTGAFIEVRVQLYLWRS